MTAYMLGIDGGGTRTRALILDEKGEVLSLGISGPSNYNDVGEAEAQANLAQAVENARRVAGLPVQPFAAVFMGMAGVVSTHDHTTMQRIATNLHLTDGQAVGVDHDCRIALAGSLGGRPGIVLIAGTGSSVYGMNAEGQGWRTGGWGYLIADEGSSYWLGVQAMRHAVMAYDTRGEPTRLMQTVPAFLGIDEMNEIMHRIYVQKFTRADVASLGPLVMDAAREGDKVGLELIRQATKDLADTIAAAARYLDMATAPTCEVSIVGGMLNAGDIFIEPLHQAIHQALPNVHITPAEMPPVMGAGLLALQQHRQALPPGVIKRLKEQVDSVQT